MTTTLMEKITQLIRNKGVTAYQVCKDTGVSPATLSKIINGETQKLSNKTAVLLSDYFNVERDFLLMESSKIEVTGNVAGIVNNSGNDNFFTQSENARALLREKDRRIEELQNQVNFLRDLIRERKSDAER